LSRRSATDPRLKQDESEQILTAIKKNRGTAKYVLYPDEGDRFASGSFSGSHHHHLSSA